MCRLKFLSIVVLGIAASLVCAGRAVAQVMLDPAWPENPTTFGGERGDGGSSVQQTTDGGYIVAGSTNSFGAKGMDVYLIKLDARGNLDPAWDPNPKTFRGEEGDEAYSVQQTVDGGYIVAGYTESFGAGDMDVYLIKLDAQGNLDLVWDPNPKTFGGEGRDIAHSVEQTTDGGYIVAGRTASFGAGSSDVYLLKLDAEGDLDPSWDPNPKTFGGADADEAHCVQQTADGGYIVVGETESASFGAEGADVYLLKLDSAGNLDPAWHSSQKTFGGFYNDRASHVQQTADGGYIVAGETFSFGAENGNVYLIKLDPQGNLHPTWDVNPKTFGDDRHESAHCVQQTTDGGYIVAGDVCCFDDHSTTDVYLLKLDSHGNLDPTWDPNPRVFDAPWSEQTSSVQQTRDGGYIVAGKTDSFGVGVDDVLLLKLAPARHFLRSDCNGDGKAQGIPDAVSLLSYNFLGTEPPSCLAACDANGDGDIGGTTDAIYILSYFFLGSAPPPAPFPDCDLGVVRADTDPECETQLVCP